MAASNTPVRYTSGIPVIGDFASSSGSPLVIDVLTGKMYYLSPAGVVTQVVM